MFLNLFINEGGDRNSQIICVKLGHISIYIINGYIVLLPLIYIELSCLYMIVF